MSYVFDNFTPHSFERFSQSICIPLLGPGTIIFGSGTDGAREAVFEGEVAFPSQENRWNGYIVAQAKCRERPKSDIRDARWLVQQLEKDLKKFLDDDRGLRKPDYYLVMTNIFLSSVPDTGGKAIVEDLLRRYAAQLGIKGFHVIAADELCAILDNNVDLRRSYTAWVTPSDVLSSLVDSLRRPNLTKLLPLALARDLRNERDARLRDAGQETEKPVYLDQVFVDLPVEAVNLRPVPQAEETNQAIDSLDDIDIDEILNDDASHSRHKIVQQLIRRTADKLDPESLRQSEEKKRGRNPRRNRIVIMGGPGQGKSTIGQYLSQYLRAKLLRASPTVSISGTTKEIIEPVLARAEAEHIELLGPCRFPLRIDLPSYADALKKGSEAGTDLNIMQHVANNIKRSTSIELDVSDIREWLTSCPCVIIFDGLDEVPETSNRTDVIKEIDALWDEVHLHNMDVLAIVTSRPQGYNNALSEKHWEHWEMAPLSEDEATRYANQLATVRLSDPERRASIIGELQRAFADPTTRLLSTSPLQVAILFGIANLKGAIPQDRWELFHRYYTLLRDREAQKPGTSSAIIRDFKREIDALHYECGFILQSAAESAGGNRAFLTPDQFKKVIAKILNDDGHEPGDVENIVSQLMKFATNRLVLLSSRVENEISFDVRSLQEYMAAAQITGASSVSIIERLRIIAGAAHWRHVFRIASSRIFSSADLSFLREDVISICHSLDNGDLGEGDRLVRNGARLAVDLLLDGVALSAPKLRKNLVRRALSCIDVGPSGVGSNFSLFFDSSTSGIFRSEIRDRLHQQSSLSAFGALHLCAILYQRDPGFVDEILEQAGSLDSNLFLKTFTQIDHDSWSNKLNKLIIDAQQNAGPSRAITMGSTILRRYDRSNRYIEPREYKEKFFIPSGYIEQRRYDEERTRLYKEIPVGGENVGRFAALRVIELQNCHRFVLDSDPAISPQNWLGVVAVSDFCKSPTAASLADAYSKLLRAFNNKLYIQTNIPWPISSIIQEIRDGDVVAISENQISDGLFGDSNQWADAEERWQREGVSLNDLEAWKEGYYLNKNIGRIGFAAPSLVSQVKAPRLRIRSIDMAGFENSVRAMPSAGKKLAVLEVVARSIVPQDDEKSQEAIVEILLEIIKSSRKHFARIPSIYRLVSRTGAFWKNNDAIKFLDRRGRNGDARYWTPSLDEIYGAYRSCPEYRGLLYYLMGRQHSAGSPAALRANSAFFDELKSLGAFEHRSEDSPFVRRAVTAFQLQAGVLDVGNSLTLSQDLLGLMPRIDMGEMRASLGNFVEQQTVQAILQDMVQNCDKSDFGAYGNVVNALQAEINAAPSKIGSVGECDRLKLPNLAFC